MAKLDEVSQLSEAYRCLQTQPYEAQVRMLDWLTAKVQDDYAKAMQSRRNMAKARVRPRLNSSASQNAGDG